MLDDLMKDSSERWAEIDRLSAELQGPDPSTSTRLMLLLVEHLRPVQPSAEQISDISEGLTEMLGSLMQSAKGGK